LSVDDTRRRFRELYRLHRRRGEVRPVEKYQRMFHGHSALVAREYENLRNEALHNSSDDRDADLTAARQVRDKVEITLNRLGQPSSERYRLRKELGRGAMGAVYDVRDGTLGRHVAMKVINEKISAVQRSARGAATGLAPAPLLVRRFVQEARITAFLDHPGVPPVHEMGIDPEGHLFFTMKVVDGLSFQEVLEQRAEAPEEWPLPRLLQIFVRVCDTLSFAHTKGVVHRDLKPANLMVGSFGEVYVMDWGLAKVLADAPVHHPNDSVGQLLDDSYGPSNALSATMMGSALGSPPFMPPEQAFGAIGDIGPHSDIYALGAMLYQVLTDHAPYTQPGGPGGATAIIAAVKRGPPPSVKELAPDAPDEVAAIVEKAMARMVSDRYASMDALSEALQA
jgi:serine/threonine protein kinase